MNGLSLPTAFGAAAPADDGAVQREKLEDAAVKFEGMFIAHLLNEMRKANESLGPDPANTGRQPGAGLLDHAYRLVADDIAAQRAFGIADAIVAQMLPAERPASPST